MITEEIDALGNLYNVTQKHSSIPVHNWYVKKFKKIPSEFVLKKQLSYDSIIKKYSSNIISEIYGQNGDYKTELSAIFIKLDEEGTYLYANSPISTSITAGKVEVKNDNDKKKKKVLNATILFSKKISEIKSILDGLPYVKKEKEGTKLHFLSKDNFVGFYLKPMDVSYKSVNLNLNYNDDLLEIDKIVLKGLKSNKTGNKGLVLLYGLPGSGKTTYIRHLVKRIKNKKFVIVPNNMVSHLTEPTFLNFISTMNNVVLVLEESEKILVKRDSGDNGSISNILNISDGLLGDCLNFKIIATFNTDLKYIDEALLRKGRLLAKYEFKELEQNKADILREKLGVKTQTSNLLSEIYNSDDKNFSNKKKQIGFAIK